MVFIFVSRKACSICFYVIQQIIPSKIFTDSKERRYANNLTYKSRPNETASYLSLNGQHYQVFFLNIDGGDCPCHRFVRDRPSCSKPYCEYQNINTKNFRELQIPQSHGTMLLQASFVDIHLIHTNLYEHLDEQVYFILTLVLVKI